MKNSKYFLALGLAFSFVAYSTQAIAQQAPRGTRQPLVPTKPGDVGGGVTTQPGTPLYPPGTRFDGVGNIPKPTSGSTTVGGTGNPRGGTSGGITSAGGGGGCGLHACFEDDHGID
jgi:hypothetical protein